MVTPAHHAGVSGDTLGDLTGQLGCGESAQGVEAGHW